MCVVISAGSLYSDERSHFLFIEQPLERNNSWNSDGSAERTPNSHPPEKNSSLSLLLTTIQSVLIPKTIYLKKILSESSGDFLQFLWDSPIYYFGCLLQLNLNNSLSCYCIKGCFGSSLIKMVVSSIPLAERYVMSGSLGFEVSPAGRLVQKWGGLHSLIPVTPRKWTKAASVLLQTTDFIQLISLNLFKQAWWSVRQQCYYHLSRYKKTDVKEFCPQGTSSTDCQDELYVYTVSCDDC